MGAEDGHSHTIPPEDDAGLGSALGGHCFGHSWQTPQVGVDLLLCAPATRAWLFPRDASALNLHGCDLLHIVGAVKLDASDSVDICMLLLPLLPCCRGLASDVESDSLTSSVLTAPIY